ncbi:hypothetical protein glysoja_030716 [Glycine soja]|uniref:DOG1 domain-containing protein n=1 Tax=Glycine soja TaxID=3848 RepID=A0A0B2SN66_GLYSO|nr:hypothetical protein glysoja_030716 [Glycine soja]
MFEQNQHLKELLAAESTHLTDEQVQALNGRVIEHYEHYYTAKPSMAFHLLYSKFGLQFEARFDELIRGLRTHDLGDISASQLAQLDETQRRTIIEEREVTDLMETHQESLVDAPMVELSHVVAEMIRANETGENKEIEDKVESTLCQWWKVWRRFR